MAYLEGRLKGKIEAAGGTMRTLALALLGLALFVAVAPLHAQQPQFQLPKDGNGLLEYCSHVVSLMDSPSSEGSPDSIAFADSMKKFDWCVGYLQATRTLVDYWNIRLALLASGGLKLTGPEKVQEALLNTFSMCIPGGVSYGQTARVLVKWLRDHPERLHEPPEFLTIDALKDAFPCREPAKTNEPITK